MPARIFTSSREAPRLLIWDYPYLPFSLSHGALMGSLVRVLRGLEILRESVVCFFYFQVGGAANAGAK